MICFSFFWEGCFLLYLSIGTSFHLLLVYVGLYFIAAVFLIPLWFVLFIEWKELHFKIVVVLLFIVISSSCCLFYLSVGTFFVFSMFVYDCISFCCCSVVCFIYPSKWIAFHCSFLQFVFFILACCCHFCLDVLLSFLFINWYLFLYFPCLCMIVCFVAVFSFGCTVVFCICPLFLLLFVFCFVIYCVSLWFLVFCDLLGMLLSFLFLHGLFHLSK